MKETKGGDVVNNKNIFAENLRRYMEEAGKTRRDICEALGISYFTISSWVNGTKYPRMDKVEMLAQYFGIQKSDLIEERLTPEKEKDADFLAEIFVRMRTEAEYGDLVKFLFRYDAAKCKGIHQMLRAFDEQPSNEFK